MYENYEAHIPVPEAGMAGHMEEYDAIAKEYRDSKQLPFRDHVERHTLFQLNGLERLYPDSPAEGDTIRYIVTNADGREFEFNNYYLTPETYEDAFQKTGFRGFRWVNVSLHPSQRGNSFWNEFMNNPPIVAFEASR